MERADKRFAALARDVGLVLEQHSYPRVNGDDRSELEKVLFDFLYGSRGAAGELEKRLNGTAAPLVSEEGTLDSYDCLAVAHELRRKRAATGALVIATDANDQLSIGLAADEGALMDVLGNEIIESLEGVLKKRGWAAPEIKDVGMDFTVPGDDKERAS